MTRILSALFMVLLVASCARPYANEDGDLNGSLRNSRLLERIDKSQFVLLGEKHDNETHHQIQALLLGKSLTNDDVVVFEMLTRDQQPVIDQFQSGDLSLAQLPAALNWKKSGWPSWEFYAPLFNITDKAGAKILYGSYPRSELKHMMTPDPDQPFQMPDHLKTELEEQIRIGHCDLLPKSMISPMSLIQVAKDRLMADQMIKGKRGGKAYLIAGDGHVRKDIAVPYHLAQKAPDMTVFVLGILEEQAATSSEDLFNQYDSIWTTDAVPEEDYCAGLRKKFGKQ